MAGGEGKILCCVVLCCLLDFVLLCCVMLCELVVDDYCSRSATYNQKVLWEAGGDA